MKKLLLFPFACIASCMLLSLVACSSDDDDEATSTIAKVSEDVRPFIGKWNVERYDGRNSNTYTYYMFADGKMLGGISENKSAYDWSYDTENKILSTSETGWYYSNTWQIKSLFDNVWTGVDALNSEITCKAEKDTITSSIMQAWIYGLKWQNDETELKFGTRFTDHLTLKDINIEDGYEYSVILRESSNNEMYSFCYDEKKDVMKWELCDVEGRLESRNHTIIELYHPYSYNNLYLNVTAEYGEQGKILGTYSGKFLPYWRKNK